MILTVNITTLRCAPHFGLEHSCLVMELNVHDHWKLTFMQAVFSFEPEIPGNFTWSSSFTVHFSPKLKWPPENKLKLEWNPAISSLDGEHASGLQLAFVHSMSVPD